MAHVVEANCFAFFDRKLQQLKFNYLLQGFKPELIKLDSWVNQKCESIHLDTSINRAQNRTDPLVSSFFFKFLLVILAI